MKKIILAAAMLGAASLSATTASAQSNYVADLNSIGSALQSTNADSCLVCHSGAGNSAGDKGVTEFSIDYEAGVAAFGSITQAEAIALGTLDSDGDGLTNAAEAAAGSNFWGVIPTTTTTSSSSGGGCITSSATTPLMMVLAMLALGFFVRRKKA